MSNVNKPVIPRQVAEAIEWMRSHQRYTNYDIIQRLIAREFTNGHHAECIRDYIVLEDGFDTLLSALVNGYEIEKSAEELAEDGYERIRAWHAGLRSMERNDDSFSGRHAAMLRRDTIDSVLTILGITIEGVNA